ncbi:MAG: transcription termination/antitermination NusG family protein [Thermoproteota archaeon]|nr:transcription termination/antitermination NusG family protein [Thermoproteota archaeon]
MLYIKQRSDKKVIALLKRNKIEIFSPLRRSKLQHTRKSKLTYEPLFGSYLFANLAGEDFSLIKRIKNVISIVCWKDKPAKIRNEEIEGIKEFTSLYLNIEVEKIQVNIDDDDMNIMDRPQYTIDGNIVSAKSNSIKLDLPSVGFRMIAEIERKNKSGEEKREAQKRFIIQFP